MTIKGKDVFPFLSSLLSLQMIINQSELIKIDSCRVAIESALLSGNRAPLRKGVDASKLGGH